MVLAPLTPEQQATARKLATPVDGADDQGPAADPAFMQTLFSRLLMILGALNANFVPVLLAVNALTHRAGRLRRSRHEFRRRPGRRPARRRLPDPICHEFAFALC